MGEYVNTLSHGIVIRDENSVRDDGLTRVAPGGTIDVSGDDEKRLKDMDGIESASSKEGKAVLDAQSGDEYGEGTSTTDVVGGAIATARAAAKRFLAVTNQIVIGDDEAPYGPPTGTITTKQAAVEEGGDYGSRQAFADHEAVTADVEGKAVTDVAMQQAKDTEAVDDLAQDLLNLDPEEAEEMLQRSPARGGLGGFGPSEAGVSATGVVDSGRAANQAAGGDSDDDEGSKPASKPPAEKQAQVAYFAHARCEYAGEPKTDSDGVIVGYKGDGRTFAEGEEIPEKIAESEAFAELRKSGAVSSKEYEAPAPPLPDEVVVEGVTYRRVGDGGKADDSRA